MLQQAQAGAEQFKAKPGSTATRYANGEPGMPTSLCLRTLLAGAAMSPTALSPFAQVGVLDAKGSVAAMTRIHRCVVGVAVEQLPTHRFGRVWIPILGRRSESVACGVGLGRHRDDDQGTRCDARP